jgi:hypothetical protein
MADTIANEVSAAEQKRLAKEATRSLVGLAIRQTQEAQDEVMSRWPRYQDVREELAKEIAENNRVQGMQVQELLAEVVYHREAFWREGGNLSPDAWKAGYRARLLAEIALERAPNDGAIIDELVETLQSVTPLFRYEKATHQTVVNQELKQQIEDLRQGQFSRAMDEIANGRQPDFADFTRAADLLQMVQAPAPDNQRAKQILACMKDMCEKRGWPKFAAKLRPVEATIDSRGNGYAFNISLPTNSKPLNEHGYGRRLPSFRGPAERGTVLLEQLDE